MGRLEDEVGARGRAIFTREVLRDVASAEDQERARRLAESIPDVGEKLALEVLAHLGWWLLEAERCRPRS